MTRLLSLLVLAATVSGQSFLNTSCLGELCPPANARIASLGSPAALSYLNPGILIHLDRTSFTGTIEAGGVLGTESGNTRFIGYVRPSGFHAAVPLLLQTRLLLGLDQRFSQDFDVWSESLPETEYRYHVLGRGGIHALKAGLAKSINGVGCLGIEYNYLLGAAREDWRFELPEHGYLSTDTIELNYSAHAVRLGASARTGPVTLAGFYEPRLSLTARSIRHVHGAMEDSIATHDISLPHVFMFGASYRPVDRLLLATGLEYRPWSGILVNDTAATGTRDALAASLGAEYPVGRILTRLGYSYRQWYYGAGSGGQMDEHRVDLGAGIPIPGFGFLDVTAGISNRTAGGLTETAGRLALSLAYREAWLKRIRHWGD